MRTDVSVWIALVISAAALIVVTLIASELREARQESAYWRVRYELLAGTLLDDEFDPELLSRIPNVVWAMPDVRARAYTYLARWVQTSNAAQAELNAHWQIEPDDGLREMAETALRRRK